MIIALEEGPSEIVWTVSQFLADSLLGLPFATMDTKANARHNILDSGQRIRDRAKEFHAAVSEIAIRTGNEAARKVPPHM